uniref:FHA domain-containing protein n=1 Tax=Panagrolaimus davidi TaxID=227884 RepID=A0A914P0U2_9BILA
MLSKKTQEKKRCSNAQMTSTVKLVKSFYEQSINEPIQSEIPVDNQIIWPDESIFPKQNRELFKLWTTEDDFLLIASYSHVNDYNIIFTQCTFSHLFSVVEIRKRIERFLCDPVWRDLMLQRINKLDSVTRNKLDSKIPFGPHELAILECIPSTSDPDMHFFLDCLCKVDVFGTRRTAADLQKKWEILRNHRMLEDQMEDEKPDVSNAQKDKDFVAKYHENFADYKLEFLPEDFELSQPDGMQNEDECQHIASLRYGDFVFTIEMPMTIIGRRNASFEPDIDLNLFGESERIAAKQVALEYDETRQFILRNIGSFPVLINGSMLVTEGNEIILPSKCLIKFDRISLIFRVSGSSFSKFIIDWNVIK